jgi:hypothetical protein
MLPHARKSKGHESAKKLLLGSDAQATRLPYNYPDTGAFCL